MELDDTKGIRDSVYEEVVDETVRSFTPRPQKPITMSFPDAMQEVAAGKKVRKLEWESEPECFGVLHEGRLQIFRNGKMNDWIVSDGDLAGEDFVVVP